MFALVMQRRSVWAAALHQPDRKAQIWGTTGKTHQFDDPSPEPIHGLQVKQGKQLRVEVKNQDA